MSTSSPPAAPTATASRLYWRLWKKVPFELAFLALAFPLAVVGFSITIGLFAAGVGTLVTFFIGVILIIVALYVSRGFGLLELVRLEWAGRPPIERPEWQDARARQGFLGWLRSMFGNGHYWLYLLHTMVVNFIIATFSWVVTVVWLSTAFSGITYWIFDLVLPRGANRRNPAAWVIELFGGDRANIDLVAADRLLMAALGLAFLATLPFVTRALVLLHDGVARLMLGAFKSDALQREVIALEASRGAAISAEGHSLRRLERDIHDGPQQRLVRLQMDLSAAERQLDTDTAKARGLISEAMQQSKEALEELRALSRGFAPPMLLDRGLVAALESAASRSTVPTRVVNELPEGAELPQEIERNAYFVASEALANAAKHSGATEVVVRVGVARSGEHEQLALEVTDNGVGGAARLVGHGLAGMEERLHGLGGALTVHSPAGGPTEVSATLPLPSSESPSILER